MNMKQVVHLSTRAVTERLDNTERYRITAQSCYCTLVTTSESNIFFSSVFCGCRSNHSNFSHFHVINNPTGAVRVPSSRGSTEVITALPLHSGSSGTVCVALCEVACSKHSQMSALCSLLSLTETLCVRQSEFDTSRQMSDDVCIAHQLGEHVVVPHDIRTKQIALW